MLFSAHYRPKLHNIDEIIKQSNKMEDGNPSRYHLKCTDSPGQSESHRKMTFGERDKNKPHKTILMVGETGIGKTTLINVMVNYILGVQREDKVWFEITDDQSDRTSAHSQTSIITVYGFYLRESPIDLTVIDTPGYGNTRGIENDKEIAVNLLSLSKSAEEIHEIDAVCLVIKATQSPLSNAHKYILDAVQSLFGRDIAENIVLLLTHSRGAHPKNVLTAVKEAKIKCAVNDKNQPVYFLFDNCQSDTADEEYEKEYKMLEQSWSLSFIGITLFYKFLDNIKPKPLKMTQYVLQKRTQLDTNISEIQSHVQMIEQTQNELKQTKEELEQNKEHVKKNNNFENEVEVSYKELVEIEPSIAKYPVCCTICKENCHTGSVWFSSYTSREGHCEKCPKKCPYKNHTKGAKIYVTIKKKERRTNEDSLEECNGKIRDGVSSVKKLEEELQELEKKKIKRVIYAFCCVETLQMIALNTDSVLTLLHVDFLIEKLKEINEPEKAETLENIKKGAGEENTKT